jgi:hypothetical protein
LESILVPYFNAPITVSLYNVTLLFLSGLASRQLNEVKKAQRKAVIAVSFSLIGLWIILIICILAEKYDFPSFGSIEASFSQRVNE